VLRASDETCGILRFLHVYLSFSLSPINNNFLLGSCFFACCAVLKSRRDFLFGTIGYFRNYFNTAIMNNLSIESPNSLEVIYALLGNEIKRQDVTEEVKTDYYRNLEKAYKLTKEQLFGMEEEE